MLDVPTRNADGGLDCPRCSSPLQRAKAPFFLHGEYVGRFESLVCDICNYSALTSSGYDEAIDEARKYGLVGLQEEIIKESYEPSLEQFVFAKPKLTSNTEKSKQILMRSNVKVEGDSASDSGEIPIHMSCVETRTSKITQVLIKQ